MISNAHRDELFRKWDLVFHLEQVYKHFYNDIVAINYHAYEKNGSVEEFIVLTWDSGGRCFANNNINSLSATARNVARMLDGGVYENIDLYNDIMKEENGWTEIRAQD